MEELEEFLERQRELNVQMIQDLISSQNLLYHNLSLGLTQLKQCVKSLPQPKKFTQFSKSKVQQLKQVQHAYIRQSLIVSETKSHFILVSHSPEIYRDRLFQISFRLNEPLEGTNTNIYVKLKLFTSEKFPQEVTRNMSGKPIFKGITQIPLTLNMSFSKLQITEVSSHFPSGKFIFVIFCEKVQPLILDNIAVKAKRMDKRTS